MNFVLRNPAHRSVCIEQLCELDLSQPWEVTVKPYKKKRSVDQNARYWAILQAIAKQLPDETGKFYSVETWHRYMKQTFLGVDTVVVDGDAKLIEKPSRKLNVVEFNDYMTQVEVWAVEHDVNIGEE